MLVRGRSGAYMMPGGGIEPDERPSDAAIRELREETGLEAARTKRLFVWESATNRHHVFRIEADGDVKIGHEVGGFRWWGRKEALPTFPHVEAILSRL